MRKIIVSIQITLDGFTATGPDDSMDWAFPGVDESQQDLEDFLRSVDTSLMGRVTAEGLAGYWPDQTGEFAEWFNKIPKIAFSRTPRTIKWGKWDTIRLIHANVAEEVKKLKQQDGRDMVIFGSPGLVKSFTNLGLIDEYRLVVHPTILAHGIPLFEGIEQRRSLKLLETKPYPGGSILVHYQAQNVQAG
jgi:dihydrofolate reductase